MHATSLLIARYRRIAIRLYTQRLFQSLFKLEQCSYLPSATFVLEGTGGGGGGGGGTGSCSEGVADGGGGGIGTSISLSMSGSTGTGAKTFGAL